MLFFLHGPAQDLESVIQQRMMALRVPGKISFRARYTTPLRLLLVTYEGSMLVEKKSKNSRITQRRVHVVVLAERFFVEQVGAEVFSQILAVVRDAVIAEHSEAGEVLRLTDGRYLKTIIARQSPPCRCPIFLARGDQRL